VQTTGRTGIPGQIGVTLLRDRKQRQVECNLLLSRTVRGFFLGISQSQEQLPVDGEGNPLIEQATILGRQTSPPDGSSQRAAYSTNRTMLSSTWSAWTAWTEQVFSEANLEEIKNIGKIEHWLVDCELVHVEPDRILGQGSYGVVNGARYCGSRAVVKFQKDAVFPDAKATRNYLASASNELRVMRGLRHPNIVLFHGAWLTDNTIATVLEEIRGQKLKLFLSQPLNLVWQEIMMLDTCSAIWYLHAQMPSIVHGDVKPANIMVEVVVSAGSRILKPLVKLIDFGLSRVLSGGAGPMGGTSRWMAPEVRRGAMGATSADIFSLGCIMFFILTRLNLNT